MNMRNSSPSPLPHQQLGSRFLRDRPAAALFDEQGLGKTKQLIDAVSGDIEDNILDAALIICPNSLKTTWGEEIEKHSSLRYALFGAGRTSRRQAFSSLRAAFYVINYEAVAAELASLKALLRFKRFALVLDESHRIKTPIAKVTGAVLALREYAVKRFIMSGTPVANKPEDLWSQLFFLDDGMTLGTTFKAFRDRYCSKSAGYVRLEELRERLSTISLRRQKDSTLDLPPKTVTRIPVSLSGDQLRMYEELRNELAIWVRTLSGDEVLTQADNILTRLVRLAQLASNPGLIDAAYVEPSVKFLALDQLLSIHLSKPTNKVIVWTSFVPNIPALVSRYKKYVPVALHGDMAPLERDNSVSRFRRDPAVRLLVANPAAAREGLTLTESHTAIYLDRTFNLVDFLQSQDRIHRISQTHPCDIVLLIAEGTIDEFIDFSLAQKQRLASFTQGDTPRISATDLSLRKPDVIRALLTPSADH